jgi:predicted GIY-YIG superfamily endonuclease
MPYYVYVVELDKAVIQSKKFRLRNPQINPKKACFYVGQSAHLPEIRFQKHKEGYKANTFVKRYGVRLRPRTYNKYNPIKTREEALNIEQYVTNKLRKKGHGVWSN